MSKKDNEIEVGQIWQVETDCFYATGNKLKNDKRQPVYHLKTGEKIEIRYPYEWHYRTELGEYFESEPHYILANCKKIGTIIPSVKSSNKASLEEILRLDLYDKTN